MHGQSKVRRCSVAVLQTVVGALLSQISQCIGLAIRRHAWLGYARAMYGRITYGTAMVKQR